ncbi:sulfatase-like hydrolase/transferase [Paractinoplanes rhizophilus]|uniref:Sulfatase-like hydrolase/transferase n=1 Tax=Paractinoplanes rhizophilus TaxID=1416877 RepID=A0ABW2HWN1_9ACTN
MLLRRIRTISGAVLTVLAAVLVYVALVVPDAVAKPKNGTFLEVAFLRLPIEAIIGAAVLLALSPRWRKPVAALFGLGLGLVVILKVVNMGFRIVLGRRFNPVLDWPLFQDGFNALSETDGRGKAIAAAVGAVVLSLLALVVCTLAVLRLTRLTVRFPGPARRTLAGLSAVWMALAISGITWFPNAPVASDTAADLLKTTVTQVPAAIKDQRQFAYASEHDPYRNVAARDLVSGLAGKDVVIGVVESYGRSALADPGMSAIVSPALAADERKLSAAGFSAKSGWLTSSTYGGGSWLAHASFQSGLWITSQQRYRQLAASDRITLTSAFHKAGWQTVGMEPGNTVAWPEASFYGYDTVYDSRNLGYQGPRFGWSRMPDQYTLAAFQRNVYATKQRPLMAEITLTSSHEPWTAIPRMIDWDEAGDGSVYAPMVRGAEKRGTLWGSPERTQIQYAKSIAYSVDSLISWAAKYGDKNLVLIMFGDHQPMPIVSGADAGHDVPVTIIAHDRSALERVADWNWADGLRPRAGTPVWRMDEFRDKFFAAYGTQNTVALRAPR